MSLRDKPHLRLIIKWAIFWLSIFAIHSYAFKPYFYDQLSVRLIISAFFFINVFVGLRLFATTSTFVNFLKVKNVNMKVFLPYVSFILIAYTIGELTPITKAQDLSFQDKGLLFPYFYFSSSLYKATDVFFQQTLIFILVVKLQELGFNLKKTLVYFGIAFFSIHVPAFILMNLTALLFIVPSLLAGFIFAYLIIKFEKGIIFSASMHLGFYLILGTVFRVLPNI